MAEYIKAFQKLIVNEGGYVNDPDDPGGETYKGISRKNWPGWLGWHIIELLKNYPDFPASLEKNADLREEVGIFYLANYWNRIKGDQIINQAIAESIFDFSVNAGIEVSVTLAQMVAGVKADGVIGPITLDILNRMDPEYFIALFTVAKIRRYVKICVKRPLSRKYFYGWVVRALN